MGFGKSKKAKTPPEVKPQIVVSPGSGSGLTENQFTSGQQQQRTEAAPSQTSLLTQNDEDENLKKKGIY